MKEDYNFYRIIKTKQVSQLSIDFRDYLKRRNLLEENGNKKVLILTSKFDYDSFILGVSLIRRNIDYIRVNIEDVPLSLGLLYEINNQKTYPHLVLDSYPINLDEIGVVWLRDFDIHNVDFGLDLFKRHLEIQQWVDVMASLHKRMKSTWINDPIATEKSQDKFGQLHIAKSVGFSIPKTVITNRPSKVAETLSEDIEIVAKILHHHNIQFNDTIYSVHNRLIKRKDLIDINLDLSSPLIFQEFIRKKSEIRVTIIGDRIHATELTSEHQKNPADIHDSNMNNIQKKTIKLSESIKESCIQLLNQLDLICASIDLIEDTSGTIYFLEVNAIGDWYWIEKDTQQEITNDVTNLICQYLSS